MAKRGVGVGCEETEKERGRKIMRERVRMGRERNTDLQTNFIAIPQNRMTVCFRIGQLWQRERRRESRDIGKREGGEGVGRCHINGL